MIPSTRDPAAMGWAQCTSEGSEEAELRVWMSLTIREKLAAVEEMAEFSRSVQRSRERRGLPCLNPDEKS